MRRIIPCLLMLATVTVATAHEERRWPAWLSAGQDDAVVSVANTQGAIPQATLLTSFGDFGKFYRSAWHKTYRNSLSHLLTKATLVLT